MSPPARRGLRRIADAAGEPVTLAEIKVYLRIDHAEDDALLGGLIKAAREQAEHFLRRALMTQSWRLTLDGAPDAALPWWDGVQTGAAADGSALALPYPPLQAVLGVESLDEDGIATPFAPENYYLDSDREPGRIVLRRGARWPLPARAAAGLRIDYRAGYGDAPAAVPQPIRDGIAIHAGALYEHRDGGALPELARALYAAYRIVQL